MLFLFQAIKENVYSNEPMRIESLLLSLNPADNVLFSSIKSDDKVDEALFIKSSLFLRLPFIYVIPRVAKFWEFSKM